MTRTWKTERRLKLYFPYVPMDVSLIPRTQKSAARDTLNPLRQHYPPQLASPAYPQILSHLHARTESDMRSLMTGPNSARMTTDYGQVGSARRDYCLVTRFWPGFPLHLPRTRFFIWLALPSIDWFYLAIYSFLIFICVALSQWLRSKSTRLHDSCPALFASSTDVCGFFGLSCSPIRRTGDGWDGL